MKDLKKIFEVGELVWLGDNWLHGLHNTFGIILETASKYNWHEYTVYSVEEQRLIKHVLRDDIEKVNNEIG